MIIRRADGSQLLMTQPDHARLAADIMQHWRADGLPVSPRRSAILLAIQEHDNGWLEVDSAPLVDESSGQLLDFINAPAVVRREVWPRAVNRLASAPYAAALVAQHAVHVYRRFRPDREWAPFFLTMEAARDRYLQLAGSPPPEDLHRDYALVRIGDLASLTFCNGWTDVQSDESVYAVRLDGTRLVITPDPFERAVVPIQIAARALPDQPFRSTSEAHAAFAAAEPRVLRGIASGD
jgi:hypothetical protein